MLSYLSLGCSTDLLYAFRQRVHTSLHIDTSRVNKGKAMCYQSQILCRTVAYTWCQKRDNHTSECIGSGKEERYGRHSHLHNPGDLNQDIKRPHYPMQTIIEKVVYVPSLSPPTVTPPTLFVSTWYSCSVSPFFSLIRSNWFL